MGRFSVMTFHSDEAEWDTWINKLPIYEQDIYYSRQYMSMYERTDYRAELYVFTDEVQIGVIAYMKETVSRDYLDTEYYDIETVYGYGGPLCSTNNERFVEEFERHFEQYCKEERILAGFFRFHPLIRNERLFSNIDVLHNRYTVCLNLSIDVDQIWRSQISKQNRNVIRKCIKSGLSVKKTEDYKMFRKIYEETMGKVAADSFYYFENDYYEEMKKCDYYTLLQCEQDGEPLAAAIFMGYGDYFHYHLSGSRSDKLSLSPNNLLLWEAINYGKEKGHKYMHFGGGLTDSIEDSLFMFKKRFSSEVADFYIGKKVYIDTIYEKLIQEWEKEHNSRAKLFLQYKVN